MAKKSNVIKKTIDFNLPNPPFKVEGEILKRSSHVIEIRLMDFQDYVCNMAKEYNYLYDKVICKCKIKFKNCEKPYIFDFSYWLKTTKKGLYTCTRISDIEPNIEKIINGKLVPNKVEFTIIFFDKEKLTNSFEYNLSNVEITMDTSFHTEFKKPENNTIVKKMISFKSPKGKESIGNYDLILHTNTKGEFAGSSNLFYTTISSKERYLEYLYSLIKIKYKHAIVELPIIITNSSIFDVLGEVIRETDEIKEFFGTPYLSGHPFVRLDEEILKDNGSEDKMTVTFYYPDSDKDNKVKLGFFE